MIKERDKNNIDFLIIFIGGLGLGLLLGNEYTSSYITIIGAIFLVIAIISNLSLYYCRNRDKKDFDIDLADKLEDSSIAHKHHQKKKRMTKEDYDLIGEKTEMAYYAPDKKKGNDKVK